VNLHIFLDVKFTSLRSFLIQAPLGLLCFAFNFLALRPPSSTEGQKDTNGLNSSSHKRKLNLVGLFLLSGTLTALMVLCQLLGKEKLKVKATIVATVLSACLAILYSINERFFTSDPLTPLRLFTSNRIGFIYLIQLLVHFAYFGVGRCPRFDS
jgi:hypothetical protein